MSPKPTPEWAPRVKPGPIRRLYGLNARGIYDEELLAKVKIRLEILTLFCKFIAHFVLSESSSDWIIFWFFLAVMVPPVLDLLSVNVIILNKLLDRVLNGYRGSLVPHAIVASPFAGIQ